MEFEIGDTIRLKANCSGAKIERNYVLAMANYDNHGLKLWAGPDSKACSCTGNWILCEKEEKKGLEATIRKEVRILGGK